MRTSILQDLENTALLFPDKIAYADNTEEFTFSKLLDTAKRIGSYISDRIPPHKPIVVYMEKKACNIAAFFGAVYAGCFYVPIDSQMPADRIKIILDTLQPSLIIFDNTTENKCENKYKNKYENKHIGESDEIYENIPKVLYDVAVATKINDERLAAIRSNAKNTDILYVLFTSGSTGIPKGVTISHAAVIDFMDWICERYGLDETTTLCNQAPFYFDASVPDIYIPIKTGATVFIPPKMFYTFPKKILQYIVEKSINTLIWVPSALCNVVNCRAFDVVVPKTVKLVIFCGEVMPCKHLNVWRKHVPDAKYVNMYGPTEATYACMYYDIDRDFSDEEKLPLGRACENSEILLLTDDNKVATEGEIGEICILGQCLSNGYYNSPEKTHEVFVQNPVNHNWIELMYRTGDLAIKKENKDNKGNKGNEDNEVIFMGRKDFQIKRLGHRIELGEIESAILSIGNVESACCIFSEDIIAVYVGNVGVEELSNLMKEKLPAYMLPAHYEQLKSMPMNINGKIDRVKLKEKFEQK